MPTCVLERERGRETEIEKQLKRAIFVCFFIFGPFVFITRPLYERRVSPLSSRSLFVAEDLPPPPPPSFSFLPRSSLPPSLSLSLPPSYFFRCAAPLKTEAAESRFNWPPCTRKIVEAISLEHWNSGTRTRLLIGLETRMRACVGLATTLWTFKT